MKKKEKLIPNRFYWSIYMLGSKLLAKNKAHYKINKDNDFYKRDKKKGSIVIYNHASNIDHLISTAFFGSTRVNYVVTRRFAYVKSMRIVFKLVNAIVRDQFKADLPSILKMRKTVEKGGTICIAPTGQVSIHGGMNPVHPSIVKLIRMCKVDVYCLQMKGNHLNFPKWADKIHKYPVDIDCIKIIDSEKLKELSDDEIYNAVVESLRVIDIEKQKELLIPLKGKELNKGFTSTYYLCPKCKELYTLKETDNDIIECKACGNRIKYDKYGFLVPVDDSISFKDEYEWYNAQEALIKEGIINHTYNKTSKVKLYSNTLDNLNLEYVGEGILSFNSEELVYDGTFRDENIHKVFDLNKVYQFPFKPLTRFNIPDDDCMFEFVPENLIEVTEWGQLAGAIYAVVHQDA